MKHMRMSFAEFLRTGCFGPIRCGMKKDEIHEILGTPEEIEDYPKDRSLWCYYPVEVRFYRDWIGDFGLRLGWWDGPLPDWLEPIGFCPTKDTTMTELKHFLDTEGISFELGRNGALRTKAGVWILSTQRDAVMTVTKQCEQGGPWHFFDDCYRITK